MLLITMCDENIFALLNIGNIYNNYHSQQNILHVLVAWVSCGTGGPSGHGSDDHHGKQRHRQQLQELRTGGEQGTALLLRYRRLPTSFFFSICFLSLCSSNPLLSSFLSIS